jgi:hypothetical protein
LGALFKIAMRHSRAATGLLLFISFVAGLCLLSVLSRADDSNGLPQWCAQAKTKVEKLICDGPLRDLDRELGVFYETLVKIVEPSAKCGLVQSEKNGLLNGSSAALPQGMQENSPIVSKPRLGDCPIVR